MRIAGIEPQGSSAPVDLQVAVLEKQMQDLRAEVDRYKNWTESDVVQSMIERVVKDRLFEWYPELLNIEASTRAEDVPEGVKQAFTGDSPSMTKEEA